MSLYVTVGFLSYNENRRVMDIGYPQYISDDFPGVDGNINAAVHKDGKNSLFPLLITYNSHVCLLFLEINNVL